MINIGKYIEMAINWLTENFTLFFDAINVGIGGFIDGFQNVLMWIPFYITIVLLTLLAWYKSGKGVGVFTVFGLLLIWSMGFWNETMQTLALVLSSTIIALIIGLPLGIWSANSQRCDKILHPILDLMQTMPAFVYLIPAVLFFGLGTVPGAFATIIFATPPVVRLTSLGIKQVPKNVVEASRSFGATPTQLLFIHRHCHPVQHGRLLQWQRQNALGHDTGAGADSAGASPHGVYYEYPAQRQPDDDWSVRTHLHRSGHLIKHQLFSLAQTVRKSDVCIGFEGWKACR